MLYLPKLAEVRKKLGISQVVVAEAIGMTQQQYQRYEIGKTELPVRYLISLSKYYGISADLLLENAKEI